jgi:hypothetical protein
MKKAKHNDSIMDHTIGLALSEKLKSFPVDECPSLETIALLVEGRVSAKQRDQLMSHISICKNCYDVFRLSGQLRSGSFPDPKKSQQFRLFRPLALAASISVLVISLFIVYESGLLKKDPAMLSEKNTMTPDESADSEKRFRGKERISAEKSGKGESRKKGPSAKKADTKSKKQAVRDISPEKKETSPPASRSVKPAQPAAIGAVDKRAFRAAEAEVQDRLEEKPKAEQTAAAGREKMAERSKRDKRGGLSQVVNRYPNGNVQTLHQFQQAKGKNVLEEIREYDPAGRNTLIQNVITGSMTRKEYHPNGHLKFRQEFLEGKPHGTWIKWDNQGRVIEKQVYKKGNLIKTVQ